MVKRRTYDRSFATQALYIIAARCNYEYLIGGSVDYEHAVSLAIRRTIRAKRPGAYRPVNLRSPDKETLGWHHPDGKIVRRG
jgi:hypothetical protein